MKTIETIKQMIADGQISQEVAEKYFPELRENEDVRMKNFISNELACLRALDEKGTVRYNELTEAMAWFEKQVPIGEETLCDKCKKAQPSHSCQDITALGRCAVEHEQKPAYNDALDKIEYCSGEPTFYDSWNAAIWFLKKRLWK